MSRFRKSLVFTALALALFSAARAALFIAYRDSFSALAAWRIAGAFFGGIRFDLSIILTFFALPLLMLNLPGRMGANRRWLSAWGWIPFAILFGAGFLLAGDIAYFGEVRRHTAAELLLMKDDWRFVPDMILSGYLPQAVALLVFFAALSFVWKKALYAAEPVPGPSWKKLLVTALLLFIGIRGTFADKSLNIIDAFSGGDTAYGNLTLNGAFTAYHSSRASRNVNHRFYSEADARKILGLPDGQYPMAKSHEGKTKTGYNVVFVLMESWGYRYPDSFGANGYGVTPNFDALAARGIKFTNFYATGQRSIVGIQATLAGIPPVAGMPTIGNGLEVATISKLAEMAGRNGYRTLFLQSSRRRSFRMDSIARTLGFSEYYGMEDMPARLNYPDKSAAKFGWDYETYMFLKDKLDESQKPFFAYVFTGSTHTPYPPLGAQWEKRPHDPNNENGFLNTLYYSDWSLGQFMESARGAKWFENTVFIFTADHAQVHYGQAGYREMFHTPLLVYAPGIFREPRTVETVGSQLDIMPTIIDLLGFNDAFSAAGESLFKKREGYALVSEGDIGGIIAENGYLKHSLKNRLETKYWGQGSEPDGYFDSLEKKLLATDQIASELLKSNRWAK